MFTQPYFTLDVYKLSNLASANPQRGSQGR
jgi:hypothetical protein